MICLKIFTGIDVKTAFARHVRPHTLLMSPISTRFTVRESLLSQYRRVQYSTVEYSTAWAPGEREVCWRLELSEDGGTPHCSSPDWIIPFDQITEIHYKCFHWVIRVLKIWNLQPTDIKWKINVKRWTFTIDLSTYLGLLNIHLQSILVYYLIIHWIIFFLVKRN